ncbi:putative spermidine/putrescine transport system permease protein [Rhodoligotrophos appendicifer]|uniref:ABC transporter permease n=1 Tax=Rhodoligotrophos appendicifer TaxID=987056 RepID=UPI001184C0F9|nr:ABC transporter permease [Rhodoligotrophos appendicifer]
MSQPSSGSSGHLQWLLLALLPIILFAVLYGLPVYQLFRGSLDRFDPITGASSAFQFDFYTKFLTDSFYLGVLWRTIRISLMITVICAVAGYPISYFIARTESRFRTFMLIVLIVPMVTSPVVIAYGWLIILGTKGIVNDTLIGLGLVDSPVKLVFREFTLVLGLVYANCAFMIFAVSASLRSLDWNLVLASRSLGASGRRAFMAIVLPLSLPGLAAGSLIVFSLSMSAYAVPALVAGPQVKVMSVLIYQQGMSLLNWPFAACMSVILVVCTTGILSGWRGLEMLNGALARRRSIAADGGN